MSILLALLFLTSACEKNEISHNQTCQKIVSLLEVVPPGYENTYLNGRGMGSVITNPADITLNKVMIAGDASNLSLKVRVVKIETMQTLVGFGQTLHEFFYSPGTANGEIWIPFDEPFELKSDFVGLYVLTFEVTSGSITLSISNRSEANRFNGGLVQLDHFGWGMVNEGRIPSMGLEYTENCATKK